MNFIQTDIFDLNFNPFSKIGKEWFLVTSGDETAYNTMTASWGFMGFMWAKPVVTTVIRHNRYTLPFIEKNDLFTISFFSEKYKSALSFCGSHSGKDCDKAKETGLTPVFIDGTTTFEEAEMVLICRKLYAQDIDKNLTIDKSIDKFYETDPVHKAFTAEIVKVLIKK